MATKNFRTRLVENYTVSEIAAMSKALREDPNSKIGAKPLSIFNEKTSKKLDDMAWAIYSLTKSRAA